MNRTMTTVIVVVLLAGVALINALLSGGPPERGDEPLTPEEVREELKKDNPSADPLIAAVDAPIGSADAPVVVEWFFETDNDCQAGYDRQMVELVQDYQPHVRLIFRPLHDPEAKKRADELGLACMMSIAINEEFNKQIPGLGEVYFSAPPDMGDWTMSDLRAAIEYELEKQGVELDEAGDESDARGEDIEPLLPE